MRQDSVLFPQIDELDQSERIGVAIYGQSPLHFSIDRLVDFFDLKGILNGLSMINGGGELTWSPLEHQSFAPGQTASVSLDGEVLGIVGRLHPKLARQPDLPKPYSRRT